MTGPAAFSHRLGNREFSRRFLAKEDTYNKLVETAGPPPAWAEDLLCVARAAFLADRFSPRKKSDDRWTRRITLTVEVIEPDRWSVEADALNRLLGLLTGDLWSVRFEEDPRRLDHGKLPLYSAWKADEVALFSGGLDSTAYAARRVLQSGRVLFVAYREPKETANQEKTFEALRRLGNADTRLMPISQKVSWKSLGRKELTSRSRGLLYMATAVRAAAAHGALLVSVPENGQLSVNPPLTASRSAAASTRSVHPQTLHLLNALIAGVGGNVTVANPFVRLTKGEVCALALESGFPESALWTTMSCGRPPVNRRGGAPFHCGRCFPCLVRRSGLHHAVGADLTPYQDDLRSALAAGAAPPDLLALVRWLRTEFKEEDLLADCPLPPGTRLPEVMSTLRRGRAELDRLVESLLP